MQTFVSAFIHWCSGMPSVPSAQKVSAHVASLKLSLYIPRLLLTKVTKGRLSLHDLHTRLLHSIVGVSLSKARDVTDTG